MEPASLLIAGAVLLFCAIPVVVGRLTVLDDPRQHLHWLSFAGGVAIGYCFNHLLPKLAKQQKALLASRDDGVLGFFEHHVYLVATIGLVAYFGLGRMASYRADPQHRGDGRLHGVLVYADVVGVGAYSLLVGYLLSEVVGFFALLVFALAMALHMLGLSYLMREEYGTLYDRQLRWIFAAATALGAGIGWSTEVSRQVIAVFTAFLAGGIVSNAMRVELPTGRQFRFWSFFAGVLLFVVTNLLAEWLEFRSR